MEQLIIILLIAPSIIGLLRAFYIRRRLVALKDKNKFLDYAIWMNHKRFEALEEDLAKIGTDYALLRAQRFSESEKLVEELEAEYQEKRGDSSKEPK